jgi:glycosyltransferase involved in cell wall biosynthesis
MNINFLITHPSHISPGSFYRPYEMAKNLIDLGHETKILTPFGDDVDRINDVPIQKINTKNSIINIGESTYETFRKVIYNKRLSSFIPYDKILLSLSEKIFSGLENCLDNSVNVIQAEQEVASLVAIKIGKKLKIPIIFDVHNIWPEELVSTGHIKKTQPIFQKLMDMEKKIMDDVDHVIVVNNFMQNYIVENFQIDISKITVVPPGGQLLSNKKQSNDSLKKIIYAGLVNPREHVDLFVKSIPYIQKSYPQTKFIISEKGESINEIKNLCDSLSVKPQFYWFKSRDKARELIQECYIGALPSNDDVGRKLGTPLKLFEYISHGLPVVANDISAWSSIIKDENIGILTKDDPKDFADGFNFLLNDSNLYEQIQQNIQNLLERKYSWAHHTKNLLVPLYQKLLK